MGEIRLLIVDDHPVVRDGLRGMLESQPDFEVVGEAGDGSEAVQQVENLKPDIVLMDLRMPVMDGVTALGEIKANNPEVQVLVLTTYDSDADILPAIEAGRPGICSRTAQKKNFTMVSGRQRGGRLCWHPRWQRAWWAGCGRRLKRN